MNELTAHLSRQYRKRVTEGTLTIFNGSEVVFECLTLELPDKQNARNISCIPEGVYSVVRRRSDKYGWHLHVTGVEGRELILIHWGNYSGSPNPKTGFPDIRGCILVGAYYSDFDNDGANEIALSRTTFDRLMEVAPNGFELTIC